MLLLVEGLDAFAGVVVLTEAVFVFGGLDFRLFVPEFPFQDVYWVGAYQRQSDREDPRGIPSSTASERASSAEPSVVKPGMSVECEERRRRAGK